MSAKKKKKAEAKVKKTTAKKSAATKTRAKKKVASPSKAAPEQSDAAAAQATAGDDDVLLQNWVPVSQAIDWRLSRMAWQSSADVLFADRRVPNRTHDSGALSLRNARILLAWCQEQQAAGSLPETVNVVELGMGTGLHLRLLLDHFQRLCKETEADHYERLQVYATDVSPRLTNMVREQGLFVAHADHVRIGFMNTMTPGMFVDSEGEERVDLRGKMHFCCANYVLDLFPIDVFRRRRVVEEGAETVRWETALVRTWLRNKELFASYTDLTLEQILELSKSEEPAAWAMLAPLYSLMHLEVRLYEVPLAQHPDIAELEHCADRQEAALGADHALLKDGTVVYHSGGALFAVREIAAALAPGGYAITRDVGLTTAELAGVARIHQHFGPTVAAGVNMLQVDALFEGDRSGLGAVCHKPQNDGVNNQAVRLISAAALPETVAVFRTEFDGERIAAIGRAIETAKQEKDPNKAMEIYRLAVLDEPDNWYLLVEAARHALGVAATPDLAIAIVQRGLEVNPGSSPDLWVVHGDAMRAAGNAEGAQVSYENALRTNPRDPSSHYRLAFIAAERGRFQLAFRHIGEALAHDRDGVIRREVLELLDVSLRGQRRFYEAELQRMQSRSDR